MAGDGVSIYISALDAGNARELFEQAMNMHATGEHYIGELIIGVHGGCAQLYTDL